jgi:hypothetical protein
MITNIGISGSVIGLNNDEVFPFYGLCPECETMNYTGTWDNVTCIGCE